MELGRYNNFCENPDNHYTTDGLRQEWGFTSYQAMSERFRPINAHIDEESHRLVIDLWAPAICADCRENGGTKNRPDFWPNDHK